VPGLYAWLRRNPRLVDGALALLLGVSPARPRPPTVPMVRVSTIWGVTALS